jgi:serine protease Do
VTSLKETGTVTRGYIGVQIQPVTQEIAESLGLKEPQGALVAEVQPDTPAAKAGIKSGDAILAVDGQRLKDARELSRRIGAKQPGSTVKLLVSREKSERTVDVTLAKLPDEKLAARDSRAPRSDRGRDEPRLGLSLAPAKSVAGAGDQGVVVTDIDASGPAAERGIRAGDVILDVGGKTVSTPAEVRDALSAARKENKNVVLFRLKRDDGTRFVALPVGRG